MRFIYNISLSILLILIFIITTLLSISNPNAKQKLFDGDCTDSFNQCQHVCIPNPTNLRKFHCTCRNGYYIQIDGHSCSESPPKELEMRFEINSGSLNEKTEKVVLKSSTTHKKSTKKIVTRQKRYTDKKSKTIRPIKSLPKGNCSFNSCKNGGICKTMKSSSNNDFAFSCLCRLGFEGVTCEKTTTGVKFPKFLNGYLAFPEQILNELNFRLSLIVRPANDSQADVVIAFKQSLKGNNFILGLEQNQFIFRIETSKIRKKYRHQMKIEISSNRWYKIEIERKENEAKISLDNVESTIPPNEIPIAEEEKYIENKNDSMFLSNNFICDYCLYLGGHPQIIKVLKKNYDLFGSIENSFIGCMRNFMIDEIDIDMRRMPFYGKAVDGLGIDDCSIGLCEMKSELEPMCKNNGNCVVSSDFTPVCQCVFGYAGKLCEKEKKIKMPSFTGESFAIYDGLKGTSRSQNNIFIKFKPRAATGILFYQGYSLDKRGDFLALYFIDGYPWVSYDLGSGTISMGSHKSLTMDEWHTIRFVRVGRKGTLTIDYEEPVTGFSPGSQVQLTIKQYLQLGGVDSFDNVSAYLSIRKGFIGCIQMLFVDHHEINLINDINTEKSRNLENCESHQCAQFRQICWKDAVCIPDYDRFLCSCPLGFIEKNCQTKCEISGIRQPSFNGSSYLVYNNTNLLKKFSDSKFSLLIVINLRINQINRILFHLITKYDLNAGQYFTLTMNSNNGINVDLNNGVDNSVTNIINNLPLLSDHKIFIIKDEHSLRFSINDTYEKTISLQFKSLTNFGFSKLFVGGTDLSTTVRLNLPVESGLVGCIKDISINNQTIRVVDANDGRTVSACSSNNC